MPTYSIDGPDGKTYSIEGPEGATREQVISKIQSNLEQQKADEIKKAKEHSKKTGFIQGIKGAGQQAFGSAEQMIGENLGFPSLVESGKENIASGASKFEGTTDEDIAAAKQKGFFSGLGAQAEQHVLEPLGGMIGRFGAQTAAGAAAAAALPEELAGAAVLGTAMKLKSLVGAGVTAATDFPVEGGENIQEQETVSPGQPLDLASANTGAVAQSLLASLGIPFTGKINRLFGSKLISQAEKYAPLVKAGKMTEEEAASKLSGKLAEYGRATAVNAVTGTGLMVGTEAIRKGQAGEDVLSPEAIGQYIDSGATALTLAPIFGGMHMMFGNNRSQAHDLISKAAGDLKAGELQKLLDEMEKQPNRSVQDILNDIHRKTIEELPLTESEKDRAAKTKQAKEDFDAAWNEPSGQYTQDPETGHERELTQGEVLKRDHPELYAEHVEPLEVNMPDKGQLEMFGPNGEPLEYKPGEPRAPEPIPETVPEQGELFPPAKILTKDELINQTGIGRTAKILDKLVGLDLTNPGHLATLRSILTEYADHPNRSKALSDRIGAYLETLPKGEERGEPTGTPNGEGNGDNLPPSGGPDTEPATEEFSNPERPGNDGATGDIPPDTNGETGVDPTLEKLKAKKIIKAEPHEETWAAMSDVPWEDLPKDLQQQAIDAHKQNYLTADTVDNIELALRNRDIDLKRKEADTSRIRDAWLALRDNKEQTGPAGYLVPHWDDLPEIFKKEIINKAEKGEDGKYTIPVDTTMDIIDRQKKHVSTWVHDAWNELGIEPWDNLSNDLRKKIADVKAKYGELTKHNLRGVLKDLQESYKRREGKFAEKRKEYEDWMDRPYEIPADDRAIVGRKDLNPFQEYTKGARTIAEALKLTKEYIKRSEWMKEKEETFRNINRDRINQLIDKLISVPSLNRAQYHVSNEIRRSHSGGTPAGTYFGSEHAIVLYPDGLLRTLLHESVHAATVEALDHHIDNYRFSQSWPFRNLEPKGKTQLGKDIIKIWKASKKAAKANGKYHYGNTNIHEFIAEAFSNREFMDHLLDAPSVIKSSGARLWDNFKNTIKKLFNIPGDSKTLFDDIMNHSSDIFEGYTFEHYIKGKGGVGRLDSKIFNDVKKNTELEGLLKKSGYKPIPEDNKQGLLSKIKEPGTFVKSIQEAHDKVATWIFSSDAAFNNKMRRAIIDNPELKKSLSQAMLDIDTGQAANNQSLANFYVQFGGMKWNPELHKFEGSQEATSLKHIFDKLNEISKTHNISLEDAQIYGSRYLEARRLEGVEAHNERIMQTYNSMLIDASKLKAEGSNLEGRQLREKAENYKYKNYKLVHMNEAERAAALKFAEKIPELNQIVDLWNKEREKVLQLAIENGTISKDQAQEFLNVMDYVPFHRVDQIEAGAGLKEYTRGLIDQSVAKRFRGSEQRVNNLFDNMQRWTNYEVKKAVNNRYATNMVDWATQVMPDLMHKVEGPDRYNRGNTFSIWREGNKEYYETSDPMFMHAFKGVQSVSLPALKGFSKVTNMLRNSIVLNPVFSLAQLPQDAFSAMVSSGVKHPFMIPLEAMKEFVRTILGTSKSHEVLRKYGITGHIENIGGYGRSDNPELARALRQPTLMDKLSKPLRALSMASDNAVRQAVYNRVLKETGNEAEAIHSAQEVINFRRAGTSQATTWLRQTVPFFGAYLQSMNVISQTLSGRGLTGKERAAGHRALLNTVAQTLVASYIYNTMISDDEDYKKLDPAQRDRKLIMPGSGGVGIPLRMDAFTLMFKILPEHMYQMNLEEGAEDATKAKKALWDAMIQATVSPNVTPQLFKPLMEVYLNHDYYSGRAIVGTGIENRDTELQFTPNTSELAKALGSTGIMSPMNIDHLIKGYFGYTGGLALLATNSAIAAGRGDVVPSKSTQDMIAAVPGMSNFVPKEFGTKDANDFYELRALTDKAVQSYNELKKTGTREEVQAYLEKKGPLIAASHRVNRLNELIAKVRLQERKVYANQTMTPNEKEDAIRNLKTRQQNILKNIDTLRKQAGL